MEIGVNNVVTMKKPVKKNIKKPSADKPPLCSKCHRKMEFIDITRSSDGHSLTVRHKCPNPRCDNQWSVVTRTNVTHDSSRDPTYSDMFK